MFNAFLLFMFMGIRSPLKLQQYHVGRVLSDGRGHDKYVKYTLVTNSINSMTTTKNIDLPEDDVLETYFMDKFREKMYTYIKHSQIAQWKDLQFKKSLDVFPKGKILSMDDSTMFLHIRIYKASISIHTGSLYLCIFRKGMQSLMSMVLIVMKIIMK